MISKGKALLFASIAVSLLPTNFLHSQDLDLRGIVVDSSTGSRLPYANIRIANLKIGTSSNSEGFYIIPRIPEGSYDVVASAVGFRAQTKPVVLKGSQAVALNFILAPVPIELDEVVVTEQNRPQHLKSQPSVQLIDKAELKLVPSVGQEDVLRSITILPGIVTTSDVNAQFFVRGGNSDQNLLLLDGMKIYTPFHAFGLISSFDPEIVRSVELYTGAFPAEFGGRLSSVVNIYSRDGNATGVAGQSSINTLSSKLRLEGPVSENIHSLFTARKSAFSNTFRRFLNTDVPLSFYDGFAKVVYKDTLSPNKYSANFFASRDDLPQSGSLDPSYTWTSTAMSLSANMVYEDRYNVLAMVSMGKFLQARSSNSIGTVHASSNEVQDITLRTDVTYYGDEKDLYLFGFEFTDVRSEYDLVNLASLPKTVISSFFDLTSWFSYQLESGPLTTKIGMRMQIGSLMRGRSAKSVFQPRLNAGIDLADNWKMILGFGRISQEFITITNEDDVIPIFTPWIPIKEPLEPERADHYVVGLQGNITERLSISIEGYYKEFASIVTANRNKFDINDPDYINSTGQSSGAELLVRYGHPFVDLYYSHSVGRVEVNQNGFVYPPRFDRRHTINFLSTIHAVRNLDVSLRWVFGSGLPYTQAVGFYERLWLTNAYPLTYTTERGIPRTIYGTKNSSRLPSYHRLDLNVSYRLELFSHLRSLLSVGVVNVYDRKNMFYYDAESARRVNQLGFFPSVDFSMEFVP